MIDETTTLEQYTISLVKAARVLQGAVINYRIASMQKDFDRWGKRADELLDAQREMADVLAWWAGPER